MPDDISNQRDPAKELDPDSGAWGAPGSGSLTRNGSVTSFSALWQLLVRRRRLVLGIECGLLAVCLL